MLVKPQDVRQSLFIMTLYTMLRITYFKTFHVIKYHCINVVKMIFCLLGIFDSYLVDMNMWIICKYPVDIFDRYLVDMAMWIVCINIQWIFLIAIGWIWICR